MFLNQLCDRIDQRRLTKTCQGLPKPRAILGYPRPTVRPKKSREVPQERGRAFTRFENLFGVGGYWSF